MKIAIIGGGMMGLATAYRLSQQGHHVRVFEQSSQLGGLTTHQDYGDFVWDRFYHVILPTDLQLQRFIEEIGLGDQIRWRHTLTGFYVDQRFYSLSTPMEFLRFPLWSLWSKFRLAATILYCSRINNWRRLEAMTVKDWLIKTSGRQTYETLWKPLLLAKVGESYQRVSAVFIWSYIKRMFSARDASAKNEQLGHVAGGYKTVFSRLAELIRVGGGEISTGVEVRRITAADGGGLDLLDQKRSERFDKVIFTGPVNVLQKLVAPDLINMKRDGRGVEYLGVVCMVLVTRTPLVPYYVVNIADDKVPFTGVIGMSNVIGTDQTVGLHLTYLPKYVLSTDPFLRKPDSEINELFMQGLERMFPDYAMDQIESVHIHRAFKVQPLQVVGYSGIVPQCQTRHPDLFVLNTSQFVNSTVNNNEVIRAVSKFMDQVTWPVTR